jgi:Zn finger protein HypA/HybF involved in hydrogenase expression
MGRLTAAGGSIVTIIDLNEVRQARAPVRNKCPDCTGRLTVLRIIPGRARSEYWTMRCARCGGIHLDILKPVAEPIGA